MRLRTSLSRLNEHCASLQNEDHLNFLQKTKRQKKTKTLLLFMYETDDMIKACSQRRPISGMPNYQLSVAFLTRGGGAQLGNKRGGKRNGDSSRAQCSKAWRKNRQAYNLHQSVSKSWKGTCVDIIGYKTPDETKIEPGKSCGEKGSLQDSIQPLG